MYQKRSSVRRNTVAIPALTPAPAAEPCSHVGPPVRPEDGGPLQSAGEAKTARVPEDGPRGSRPLRVGTSLPRVPHAINQIRRGVATVIARQTAALLRRPHDQPHVVRGVATATRLVGGAHRRWAPGIGGEDGRLRDRQPGPAPSQI